MPSMNSLFAAGGKPVRTLLTTGTGTWTPSVDNALCRVRCQGGGAGGHSTGSGGGGGAMVEFWIRVAIGGIAYAVGAGGAVANDGSNTTFGQFTAMGGRYDSSGTHQLAYGGIASAQVGGVDADSATMFGGRGLAGVDGGMGGNATNPGTLAGFPVGVASVLTVGASSLGTHLGRAGNGQGNNSGGNSFFGKGGASDNAPASDAYGAGGGKNAAGRGGCIEIEDFGA